MLMLEARDDICGGATGRNGNQTRHACPFTLPFHTGLRGQGTKLSMAAGHLRLPSIYALFGLVEACWA